MVLFHLCLVRFTWFSFILFCHQIVTFFFLYRQYNKMGDNSGGMRKPFDRSYQYFIFSYFLRSQSVSLSSIVFHFQRKYEILMQFLIVDNSTEFMQGLMYPIVNFESSFSALSLPCSLFHLLSYWNYLLRIEKRLEWIK